MDSGTVFILVLSLTAVVGGVLFLAFGGALGGPRPERERLARERPEHPAVDLAQGRRGDEHVPRGRPPAQR